MDKDSSDSLCVWDIVIIVAFCVVGIISVFANFIVFATIVCSKRLRNVNSLLLLNMSISDTCLSLTLVPLTVDGIRHQKWSYGQIPCEAVGFLINVFSLGSVSTIVVLALDRYLSIIHCLTYSKWSQRKYVIFTLVVIWTDATVCSVPAIVGKWGVVSYERAYHTCIITWRYHLTYAVYMTAVSFAVPLVIMIFCYSSIIKVARRHARRIGDMNSHIDRHLPRYDSRISANGCVAFAMMEPINRLSLFGFPNVHTLPPVNVMNFDLNTNVRSASRPFRLLRQCKTVFRLLGLMIFFIICWILHVYIELKDAIYFKQSVDLDSNSNDYLPLFSILLIALHTSWNPFIYALINKNFRSEFKIVCFRIWGKRNNSTKVVSVFYRRQNHVNFPAETDINIFVRHSLRQHTSDIPRRVDDNGQILDASSLQMFANTYRIMPGYITDCNAYPTYP